MRSAVMSSNLSECGAAIEWSSDNAIENDRSGQADHEQDDCHDDGEKSAGGEHEEDSGIEPRPPLACPLAGRRGEQKRTDDDKRQDQRGVADVGSDHPNDLSARRGGRAYVLVSAASRITDSQTLRMSSTAGGFGAGDSRSTVLLQTTRTLQARRATVQAMSS
jgi:hypothetical protein